jgi:hypothetical protein
MRLTNNFSTLAIYVISEKKLLKCYINFPLKQKIKLNINKKTLLENKRNDLTKKDV